MSTITAGAKNFFARQGYPDSAIAAMQRDHTTAWIKACIREQFKQFLHPELAKAFRAQADAGPIHTFICTNHSPWYKYKARVSLCHRCNKSHEAA